MYSLAIFDKLKHVYNHHLCQDREHFQCSIEFPPVPSKSLSLLRLQPWATTKLPWLLWVLTSQELYAKWTKEHAVQFPVFHVILLICPSTAYVGGLFPFDTVYGYSTVCCPFTNWWTFGMFLVGGALRIKLLQTFTYGVGVEVCFSFSELNT